MSRKPPVVTGMHKGFVRCLLWAHAALLALRIHRTPRRAARAMSLLFAERRRVGVRTTRKYAHAAGRYFWDLYAPGWPSPAFDRYVERELDRVQPLAPATGVQTVILAVTKRCPLRCEHCCEWQALNQPERLSISDLCTLVARFQAMGATQFFLSGGEPLQRLDAVLEILVTARPGSDFWLLSSGHGLTIDRARMLRAAGLTGVALSLDHWDPGAHDRFRGHEGAFAGVEAAAANAREAGLVLALTLCPTREFVAANGLDRYAETAARLGAAFVQILEPRPVGRFAGRDVALGGDEQRRLEAFYERLNHDPSCARLPAVAYPAYAQRRSRCSGGGERYVYVDTDGALLACPFCRSSATHALDGPLETALARLRAGGCPSEA